MLTEERYQYIQQQLRQKGLIHLQEIAQELGVSESTVRRDFQTLEEAGELIRVHGGAKRISQRTNEPTLGQKTLQHPTEKDRIARFASQLIKPDDTIFLDAGTTTLAMVPYLPKEKILVVTNSIETAHALYAAQIPTVMIGGRIKMTTGALIGAATHQQIQSLNFDRAFLGMNGIDLSSGYTTPDIEEARIKQLVIEKSQYAYVLADQSKFYQVSLCHVAHLEAVPLITDQGREEYGDVLEMMEVRNDLYSNF